MKVIHRKDLKKKYVRDESLDIILKNMTSQITKWREEKTEEKKRMQKETDLEVQRLLGL